MSEPTPVWLSDLFERQIGAILLVCDGQIPQLDQERVSMGKAGGHQAPRSDRSQDIDKFRRRWRGCGTNMARLRVVKDVQEYVNNLKFSPNRDGHHGTKEWRLKIGLDPRQADVVASVYGVSRRTVFNVRKELREHGLTREQATG